MPKNDSGKKTWFQKTLLTLGVAASLLTGMSSCDSNNKEQKKENLSSVSTTIPTSKATYGDEDDRYEREKAQILIALKNAYENILAQKWNTCYFVHWDGEYLGGESPSTRIFFSKEDLDQYVWSTPEDWKVVSKKVDDKVIVEILETEFNGARDNDSYSFWEGKLEEFKDSLKK